MNVLYIAPFFVALIGYIFKALLQRIETLESKMENRPTDAEMRQVLDDKLDPCMEDLRDIKRQLEKIIDRLIETK